MDRVSSRGASDWLVESAFTSYSWLYSYLVLAFSSTLSEECHFALPFFWNESCPASSLYLNLIYNYKCQRKTNRFEMSSSDQVDTDQRGLTILSFFLLSVFETTISILVRLLIYIHQSKSPNTPSRR